MNKIPEVKSAKTTWNCKTCGHDIDRHMNYEIVEGCRCMSCYESTLKPCDYGADPEDNEGSRCECQAYVEV